MPDKASTLSTRAKIESSAEAGPLYKEHHNSPLATARELIGVLDFNTQFLKPFE
jgi:hypothetical protein